MNNSNKIVALMLGLCSLSGFNSCTDDHFDLKEGSASSNSTLWQTIANTPELSDFKEIVGRTINMSNENDAKTTTTFDRLLDGETRYTVWAPKNGTYDASRYKTLLDQAESLKNSDSETALDYNYTVLTQFVQNHVAFFNYEATSGLQTVTMNNNKQVDYEASTGMFNGVRLDAEMANIPASNGMLHVLDGMSPYRYNILDLMKNTDDLSEVYDYISSLDVTKFNENASTAGGTDEDGNIQYIDSVYTTTNELLISSNVSLSAEDSLYLAVIPTNTGWTDALNKVRSLYRYKSSYRYRWNDDASNFSATLSGLNADSLSDVNARSTILRNMYFSAGQLGENIWEFSDAEILQQMLTADSLETTTGMIVHNSNLGGVNPIFGGVVPDTASNGYVYKVDQFNYEIADTYQPEIEIDGSDASLYYAGYDGNFLVGNNILDNVLTLDEDQIAPDSVLPGASNYLGQQYLRMERGNSSLASFDMKVFNLLSGKYDVYVTLFPDSININTQDGAATRIMFSTTLLDDEGTEIANSGNIVCGGDSVSVIKVFSDLEVPYCYADIPDLEWGSTDDRTFVRMRLTIPASRTQRPQGADNSALNLYQIRFVPKD